MPDIDASIPLRAQAPNTLTSLKDVLGAATAAQGLATGAIAQKRQAVALQNEQGTLDARKAVANVMADPQYRTEDGLFDLNKLGPAIFSTDPNLYHAKDAIAAASQYNNDTINVKKNALGLSDQARGVVASAIGSVANDPNATKGSVLDLLDTLKKQAPVTAPIVDIWKSQLDRPEFEGDPKKIQAFAMNARSQVMPPTAQIESQTPSGPGFNTGQVSGMINTRPTAGPTGPVPGTLTQNVVPPTSAEEMVRDVNGNPIRARRDANGVLTLLPMNTQGGAQQPGGGAPAPMYNFPPGESPETKAALSNERQTALTTLSQAPILHTTNRGVLEEIDKTAATGTLGPKLQSLMSSLGAKFNTPEEKASAYDLVGKYLERNALQAAQGMGPNTNAGLEAQIKANGSVAYNPTAIKKITKLNDAIVSGIEAYQPGLEKAIQSSPNQIFAKRQFDQQWAQNFDPRIMQINNAVKAGDTKELADITRNLSVAERADLARKARNIEMLSARGSL